MQNLDFDGRDGSRIWAEGIVLQVGEKLREQRFYDSPLLSLKVITTYYLKSPPTKGSESTLGYSKKWGISDQSNRHAKIHAGWTRPQHNHGNFCRNDSRRWDEIEIKICLQAKGHTSYCVICNSLNTSSRRSVQADGKWTTADKELEYLNPSIFRSSLYGRVILIQALYLEWKLL